MCADQGAQNTSAEQLIAADICILRGWRLRLRSLFLFVCLSLRMFLFLAASSPPRPMLSQVNMSPQPGCFWVCVVCLFVCLHVNLQFLLYVYTCSRAHPTSWSAYADAAGPYKPFC